MRKLKIFLKANYNYYLNFLFFYYERPISKQSYNAPPPSYAAPAPMPKQQYAAPAPMPKQQYAAPAPSY